MTDIASHSLDRSCRRVTAVVLVALASLSGCAAKPWAQCEPQFDPPARELERSVFQPDQKQSPFLLVPFDRNGAACSQSALDRIASVSREGGYTDVVVLTPGWHDTWYSEVEWMSDFAAGFERARTWSRELTSEPYKPLYIGLVWPGDVTNRVYPAYSKDRQSQPARADLDRTAMSNVIRSELEDFRIERVVQSLRDRGHDLRAGRLVELLRSSDQLTPPAQIELADCLLPLYGPQGEPSAPGVRYALTAGRPNPERVLSVTHTGIVGRVATPLPAISASELLEDWKDTLRKATELTSEQGQEQGKPVAAKAYVLDVRQLVRWAVRSADLRVTKDRAYQVGTVGLRKILDDLRANTNARLHLVGHSYGCESVLAAITPEVVGEAAISRPAAVVPTQATRPTTVPEADPARRPFDSVLLLSPLVNHWSLGGPPAITAEVQPQLQARARPGAFAEVVTRPTAKSVIIVYSTRDWVAATFAPLALRQPAFLGMASADTWSGAGKGHATLGGSGPSGIDPPAYRETLTVPDPGSEGPRLYSFIAARAPVVAVDGSELISLHGDANNNTTWWLFANQVHGARTPR